MLKLPFFLKKLSILKNKTIYKGVITHMRGKQQDFRTEKYIRYGIRKFSFRAASVAIAVGLMFLGNGVVSAMEAQSAETAITTSASSQGDKETEKAEPKAETVETVKPETVSPETIKPETVNPETVKPETVNPETVNSETVKPETVNPETEKATEVKSEVAATKAATKATLANTDASQADVDAQAETVSALSTAVTESNTAEKKLRPTEIYTTNGTPGTAGTAVKTNAKYANSVETVDNNKRGNRENTHSINQRPIVKRSAIVTTEFAQNYGRKVLAGSVTNTGFSVSDPDYPSGMWIDPDKSHYSYEWLQAKIKGKNDGNQIVFSTNRTGDGIVYVTELSPSNKVLKQYTLNQNTQVTSDVFDSTIYYNDVCFEMVRSSSNSFVTKYIASKFDDIYYNTLSYFIPKLITQTTSYVDKDGKQIIDSNGNPVAAYTQKGLFGQNYTTSDVTVVNGYYAIAPANSNGVMSPYGKIGASYVKDFHDGVVITYTQTGSDGTMSASIAQNGSVLKTWTNIKPSDPARIYQLDQLGYKIYGIKNPYIPQTSDIKYVYNKLGNWIVSNPDGSTTSIIYPNDPSNPTKIADSSVPDYPVIAFIPGYTPEDHMGTPLVPVDPDDRTKGYIPPTPSDIGKDTTITYTADTQKATVTYVVEGTGTVLHTDNLEGKSGEPIDYSTVAKLAELKALGYDLVTDGFTTATDKNFDKDTKVDQSFVVTVKPHVEPIKPVDPENPNDPNKPKPGDPIDPNNPDGPKWTEDLIKQIDTTRHVNRTITSVNEKGEEVAQKVTDKVTFTREGKINSVTGEITYGNWTAKDGDTTFDKVESPVVQGYILKDAKQKEVAATTGLTVDSKDENIEVVYTKLGSWVPKVPEGFEEPKLDKPQYPNDPTDPTKPGTPTTVIPQVPGTTPKDSNGNPLKPVDPNDPSKGYVPPTPENPTEDTVITYEKDSQKATVTYVVEGTGTVLHTDNLEGKSGEPIDYSTVAKLAELKALGYDLVTDGFTTATDKNFDKDTKVDQSFVVTVKPHVEPIKPVDPENPNDPNKPKPGDPIDPNNPDGPKWTEDLIKQIDTTRHVNRTITSVNEKGEEVAQKVTDKVTFTREGKINSVTGEITYGNWTAKDGDTTFDKVESPVVQGYILKDAKQKEVAATTGLTVDSKDENIEVVYTKLGSWVPKVPEGFEEPKLDKPQYPNDPTDPTKPGTPTTVIPQVPGTTPKDSNGNPLKPVDPNDPSKGYVPPTPENPTEDTPINYVPVPQPVRPTDNGDNNGTPTTAAQPASPSTPQYMDGKRELPNTGTEDNASLAALGLLGVLSGFGLVARKKKED